MPYMKMKNDRCVNVFNESGKGYWMEGFGCLRAEGENRPSRPGHIVILNDQGGSVMDVSEDVTACLRAQDHGHPPVVCMAFDVYNMQGVEMKQMAEVKCLNPWDVQSKHVVLPDGCSESLCAGEKRWGSLPPNVVYTLNTIEQHSVCYSVNCRNLEVNRELSGTLQSKQEGGWSLNYLNPVVYENEQTND